MFRNQPQVLVAIVVLSRSTHQVVFVQMVVDEQPGCVRVYLLRRVFA